VNDKKEDERCGEDVGLGVGGGREENVVTT
jgi:hypothetical protein